MARRFNRDGVDRIAEERARQQNKLGWTRDHDDSHDNGELALAAACYAAAPERIFTEERLASSVRYNDPFPVDWHDARCDDDGEAANLDTGTDEGRGARIRLLEKAGALIAAEIDRLLALKPAPKRSRGKVRT